MTVVPFAHAAEQQPKDEQLTPDNVKACTACTTAVIRQVCECVHVWAIPAVFEYVCTLST
jgi:hypothetical protein